MFWNNKNGEIKYLKQEVNKLQVRLDAIEGRLALEAASERIPTYSYNPNRTPRTVGIEMILKLLLDKLGLEVYISEPTTSKTGLREISHGIQGITYSNVPHWSAEEVGKVEETLRKPSSSNKKKSL